MIELDTEDINDVLYYGYLPEKKGNDITDRVFDAASEESLSGSEAELVQQGSSLLTDVFDTTLEEAPEDATHIVPLSSGLDSRCILAYLLNTDRVKKGNIKTVTFGASGTWDFEIGNRIARELGIHHSKLHLNPDSFSVSAEKIRSVYRKIGRPTRILEAYVNALAIDEARNTGPNVVWSGFLGDPSTGEHQPRESKSWNQAKKDFIRWNAASHIDLTPAGYSPYSILPESNFLTENRLSYTEQLDFAVRQPWFIQPTVMPSDVQYITPFAKSEWLEFWLNIPTSFRKNRTLFKKVFASYHPVLASFPTDDAYGLQMSSSQLHQRLRRLYFGGIVRLSGLLGLNFTHPNQNYTHFEQALRCNDKFRTNFQEELYTLKNSDISQYIDVEGMFKRQQRGQNISDALRVLFSLAIYRDVC